MNSDGAILHSEYRSYHRDHRDSHATTRGAAHRNSHATTRGTAYRNADAYSAPRLRVTTATRVCADEHGDTPGHGHANWVCGDWHGDPTWVRADWHSDSADRDAAGNGHAHSHSHSAGNEASRGRLI